MVLSLKPRNILLVKGRCARGAVLHIFVCIMNS
jgi:hypothetical protein